MLLAGCGGDGRTPVLVYSPHGRDLLLLVERSFEARRPDIDVRWLGMGTQEVLDRLRFEQVNPQADVWFGGPTTIFERAVRDSLLAPYRPAWAASVDMTGWGPIPLLWLVSKTYQHTNEHTSDVLRMALFWDYYAREERAAAGVRYTGK